MTSYYALPTGLELGCDRKQRKSIAFVVHCSAVLMFSHEELLAEEACCALGASDPGFLSSLICLPDLWAHLIHLNITGAPQLNSLFLSACSTK